MSRDKGIYQLRCYLFSLLLVFAASLVNAQAVWEWVTPQVSSGDVISRSICTDPGSGDNFSGGYFDGDLSGQFTFGQNGTPDFSSPTGVQDGYVVKHDVSGAFQWAFKIGSAGSTVDVYGITIDSNGDLYVSGGFNGTAVDFAGVSTSASTTLTSTLSTVDVFLAKYNSLGELLWVVHGACPGDARGGSVHSDGTNIFITGQYSGGQLDLTGGAGLPVTSGIDGFVAGFGPGGALLWERAITDFGGSTGTQRGADITSNGTHVFVTGELDDDTRFQGPLAGDIDLSPVTVGQSSIFLVGYNASSGRLLWADRISSQDDNRAGGIATEGAKVAISGGVDDKNGAVEFPGIGPQVLGGNSQEILTAQFDTTGGTLVTEWIRMVSNTNAINSYGTDVVYNGTLIHAIGSYRATANFNGGASPVSASDRDIYVVTYDNLGNFQWVLSAGSPGPEEGYGIAYDNLGGVYATGKYDQLATFGSVSVPNGTGDNGFVARIGDCSSISFGGAATASTDTICPGDSVDLVLNSTYGLVQWEESLDQGATWSTIPSGTTDSMRYPPQVDSAWFRALNYTSGCPGSYSDTLVAYYESTPPIISCPANKTDYVDASCDFVLPDYTVEAIASDNCPGWELSQSPAIGTIVNTGVQTITLSITDTVGLTSSCTFDVDVLDTISPTITCPADISVSNDPGDCGAIINWTAPTGSDNCMVSSVTQTAGPVSGSFFPIGVTSIEYEVIDASGNSSNCSFTVTVTDSEVPTVFCPPSGANEYVDANCEFPIPDFTGSVINSDNCGVASVVQSPAPGTIVSTGTTSITVTVTDVNSNVNDCSFTFDVQDTISPTVSCIADSTQYVDGLCEYVLPDFTTLSTVSDNCGISSVLQSPLPGTILNEGIHSITVTVADPSGNSASCSFDLILEDTLAPSISCPGDQTDYVDSGCEFAILDYTSLAASTDNCSPVSLSQSPIAGTIVPKGVHTITIYSTDTSSNVDSCSFQLELLDSINPSITCPPDQVDYVDGSCSFVLSDYRSMASAADNCAMDSIQQSPQPGTILGLGNNTITLTAVDSSGNTTSCTFVVDALDTIAPQVVSCPSDIVSCDSVISWTAPSGTDNCGPVSTAQTQGMPSGSTFPIGVTQIEYILSDPSGNTDTCSFTVEVLPVIQPSFYVPDTLCDDSPVYDLNDSTSLNPGEVDTFYLVPTGPVISGGNLDPSAITPGLYDLVHVIDNGVCMDSATLSFEILPPPVLTLNPPDTICAAVDTVDLNQWLTPTTTLENGEWITATLASDTLFIVDGLQGYHDVYYLAGTLPCLDTIQVTVYVAPDVDPSWVAPGPFCDTDTIEFLKDDVTGTTTGFFTGPGVLSNKEDFDPSVGPGEHVITYAVGEGSCMEYRDDTISVVASPVPDAGPDVEVCDTSAQLAGNATNGTGVWSAEMGVNLSNPAVANPIAMMANQGVYFAVYEVSNAVCSRTDTTWITYWEAPGPIDAGPDQTLDYLFASQMQASIPLPTSSTGLWNLESGSGVPFDINDPLTSVDGLEFGDNVFSWTVSNGNCPLETDTVLIHVNDLEAPSGFSPNGDNINDRFVIPGLENASTTELVVINRWGNRVFIDSDYRNNWDGRNNQGKDLPEDTYFYELKVDGKYNFNGYVIIKR